MNKINWYEKIAPFYDLGTMGDFFYRYEKALDFNPDLVEVRKAIADLLLKQEKNPKKYCQSSASVRSKS
ncbi:MAG: hypothetical protein BRC33_03555 [Cyanobacteria bacterium SW_9_44_58]|nr:MAG: hypothetical protein BRC33_03555 [Cyanobacteria bacterium SW_9_44_58]